MNEKEDNKENLSINYHEKGKYSNGDDDIVKWTVSCVLFVFALLSLFIHEASSILLKLYLSGAMRIWRKSFCWFLKLSQELELMKFIFLHCLKWISSSVDQGSELFENS